MGSKYFPKLANSERNVSKFVKAFKGWEEGLKSYSTPPKGMFGRVAIIRSGGVIINSENLDVEYEVPFDDDPEANEAEIIVYNLSKTTIQALKKGNPITIESGYRNDTGLIFEGVISKAVTKTEGADKKTVIKALDDVNSEEKELTEITFAAGTKASYILKTLIGRLSLPLKVFSIKRDHTYTEEVKVSGGIMENIKKYAEVCGISVYINKRQIYARHVSEGDNINFTVNVETGLIGSPEEFEEEVTAENFKEVVKGYNITMLLQHRLTTAAIINLKSEKVTGQYRVRSGKHRFNNSESVTEFEVI